jgi:hypothetical protein
LLSIAGLNGASSRTFDDIWSLVRIAQISRSFNGGFCPVSLPLFLGTRRVLEELSVSMSTSSSMKGDRFCAPATVVARAAAIRVARQIVTESVALAHSDTARA